MHICADSSESLSHVVMKLCPSPQFFNQAGSQTLIAGRKSRERENKREIKRMHGACILESRNTMFESSYNCF